MATKNNASPDLPKEFNFDAHEFIEYKKGANWYIIFGLIALVSGGIFVWLKQYLSAIVVVLAVIVLFTQSNLKPKKNNYKIDSKGICINDKFYPYDNLIKFWIVITPEGNNLYFKSSRRFSPSVTIHMGSINPEPVERYLRQYLPEDTNSGEITNDKINRLLKF